MAQKERDITTARFFRKYWKRKKSTMTYLQAYLKKFKGEDGINRSTSATYLT